MFERDITLPDIAKVAGLSRTHFLRSFSRCFGQTPYQALRQRRLERAGELLKSRSTSVTDVALAVGYNNFSAFARAFRAYYGVSPSMFEG
ncbi:MAG: helix-turn-helix transcriptional regulator [Caulobacteraceae bacterium]|nr:helix-turn-helix transcriptional regulator [Caulobacteraceae bacterium]MBK8545324.1 helix-turn-helix transcriptional regulator [Caulobacteraceae bacterium]